MVEVVEKTFDPDVHRRTVVDTPEGTSGLISPMVFSIANVASAFPSWGENFLKRDELLREFWIKESILASTVYSVSARNAGFKWHIVPSDPTKNKPKQTIQAASRLLASSDRGGGWIQLITKTCVDFYTQDNGAFWEIIRAAPGNPSAPVINIAHLDSARCERTGNPRVPVIYTDRAGRRHKLMWYEVRTIEEFVSPVEQTYNRQYCAVTRALLAAQILRDIAIYKREKVSGQFSRAVHLVAGVTNQELQTALALNTQQAMNANLMRYVQPVIATAVDPTSKLDHVQIDLASLPDAFNEETTFKWYIAQLALAFGVDYQELAPLPGGNLGSGQQSQILHMKTQGKGPALVMGILSNLLNNTGLLPATVKFQFIEDDLQANRDRSEARFTRSKDRAFRINSGEIDLIAARQLAIEDGDLPEWMADAIEERNLAAPTQMFDNASVDQVVTGVEGSISG